MIKNQLKITKKTTGNEREKIKNIPNPYRK